MSGPNGVGTSGSVQAHVTQLDDGIRGVPKGAQTGEEHGMDPVNNRNGGSGPNANAPRPGDLGGGRVDPGQGEWHGHGGGHGDNHGFGNDGTGRGNAHGGGNNGLGGGNNGYGNVGNGNGNAYGNVGNGNAYGAGGAHFEGGTGLLGNLGGTLGSLASSLFGHSPTERGSTLNPNPTFGETPRYGGDSNGHVSHQPPAPDPASPHASADRPLSLTPDATRAAGEAPRGDMQGKERGGTAQSTQAQAQAGGTLAPGTNAGVLAGSTASAAMSMAAQMAAAGQGAATSTPQAPPASASTAAQLAQLAAETLAASGQTAQQAREMLAQARTPATADAAQLRQPANDPRVPTQIADPRRGAETLDPSLAKTSADAQARTTGDPRLLDPRLADARLSQALVRGDADAKQLQAEMAEKAKNANLADSARAVNGDESKMRARLAFGGGMLASTAASARQAMDWVGQQVREWGFDAKEGAEGVRAMRVVAGLIAASVVVLVVIALLYALRVVVLG